MNFTTTPQDFALDPSDRTRYNDGTALATAEHAIAVYENVGNYALKVKETGFAGGIVVEAGAAQTGIAWSRSPALRAKKNRRSLVLGLVARSNIVRRSAKGAEQ